LGTVLEAIWGHFSDLACFLLWRQSGVPAAFSDRRLFPIFWPGAWMMLSTRNARQERGKAHRHFFA
jgi:hypothetical protein